MTKDDIQQAKVDAAFQAFQEQALLPCSICGRKFKEESLAIHQRSCRPGNAAKRVGEGAAPRNPEARVGVR